MKLSKNFTLEELTHTSTGISNIPSQKEINNLKKLCENILQPLRDAIGESIHINSGYRNSLVNKEVKGASTSAHMLGTSADITRGSKEANKEMFEWIKNNCEFRQLINEKDYSWIHVEYRVGNNKKQILTIE